MTRQTADCFAEVVIDLNGIQYRCRWGQRRAYGKSDGNLQDATHEIAQLNFDPLIDAEILESKLSRTRDKIIELTRMDFQQFTRSILLAQGSFSAFLKAKSDERADILEKITGTDIYATISEHVHEKKRSEEDILSKLQVGLDGLSLLSNDEEALLSELLATNQLSQDKQQLALTQLAEHINWLDAVHDLKQKLEIYQNEQQIAQQAQQDFIPDATRLNAANKALEIDSHYNQLTYHRAQVQNLKKDQQALANDLPAKQTHLDELTYKLEAANSYAKSQDVMLQATLPILAQLRALDIDIQQHAHSLTDNTLRKENLAHNISNLSQEVAAHKLRQIECQAQLASIDAFLNNHNELNDLEADIVTFSSNGARLKVLLQDNDSLASEKSDAKKQNNHLQSEFDKLNVQRDTDNQATLDTRQQLASLQQQQTKLTAKQAVGQMRTELEQMDQISTVIEQADFKLKQVADLNQQSHKTQSALPLISAELIAINDLILTSESAISAAKSERQNKQTHLNLLRQVASLEDYIVELEDNHPCPLCGATEHPFAKHHPILAQSKDGDHEQSATFQTQRQIADLDVNVDNLQQTLSVQRIESATKQNIIEQQEQQLATLNIQINSLMLDLQSIIAPLFEIMTKDDKQGAQNDTLTPIIELLKNLKSDGDNGKYIDNTQSLLCHVKEQFEIQRHHLKSTLVQYENITESIALINKSLENEEQQRFMLAGAISTIETDIKLNALTSTGIDNKTKTNFSELNAIGTAILSILNTYSADKYDPPNDNEKLSGHNNISALISAINEKKVLAKSDYDQPIAALRQQHSRLTELKNKFRAHKDNKQALLTDLSALDSQINTKQTQLNNDNGELSKLSQIISDKTFALEQLQRQRADKAQNIENKNVDKEEKRLRDLLEQAKTEQSTVQRAHDNTAQTLAQLFDKQQHLTAQLESIIAILDTQQRDFVSALASSQFDNEESFVAARLPMELRNALKIKQQQIDYALQQANTSVIQTTQHLADKQSTPLTSDDRQTLASKQLQAQDNSRQLLETIGAMSQQLKDNENKKSQQQEKHVAINEQKDKLQVWQQLHKLIGSADGKKYRTFAQGLTFDIMVSHANTQLHKMSDRYLLIRDDNNALELNVIDNYQGGEIRSTKNLSGGEGFIISLALALGLSQMASHNIRVDSLFLDEGFGTLDDESLDIALDTLTSLQQEGKLIGVISHVQALKERILTQIQVTKLSGGFSQITGQGCQRIAP